MNDTKQVPTALGVLRRARESISIAIDTIEERDLSYNGNGLQPSDYMPNGLRDYARMILENTLRLEITRDMEKAVDLVAYTSLAASFVMHGLPPSQFESLWKQVHSKISDEAHAQGIAVNN